MSPALIASAIGFVGGLVVGLAAGIWMGESADNALKFLAGVVVVVWSVGMVADMHPGLDYELPVAVHGLLPVALGLIGGVKIVRGTGNTAA